MEKKIAPAAFAKRPEVINALAAAIRDGVNHKDVSIRIHDTEDAVDRFTYAGTLSFVLPGVPVVLNEKKHHIHMPITLGCSCHGHNHNHDHDHEAYAEVRTPDKTVIFQAGRPVLEVRYMAEEGVFHICIDSEALPEKRGKLVLPLLPFFGYNWFDVRQEVLSAVHSTFGKYEQQFDLHNGYII